MDDLESEFGYFADEALECAHATAAATAEAWDIWMAHSLDEYEA